LSTFSEKEASIFSENAIMPLELGEGKPSLRLDGAVIKQDRKLYNSNMSSFTSEHGWSFIEVSGDMWKFQVKHGDVFAEIVFPGGGYRSGTEHKLLSMDGKSMLELKDSNLLLSEKGKDRINIRLPVLSYNALKTYITNLEVNNNKPVLHVYDYVFIGSI
jgi:hypothetical protein